MKNDIETLLKILISVLMASAVVVVFIEPFRTDESFFIYRARLGISPGDFFEGMHYLLRTWFSLVTDFKSALFGLRLLMIVFFFLTVILIYSTLFEISRPGARERSTIFLLAFSLSCWLAINRGFEVRPEVFANASLLMALLLTVKSMNRPPQWYVIAAIAFLLFIPTVMSLRYWPISFGAFPLLVGVLLSRSIRHSNWLQSTMYLTIAFVLLALLIHVYLLDLIEYLRFAKLWKSSQPPVGLLKKISADIPNLLLPMFILFWIFVIGFVVKATVSWWTSGRGALALVCITPIILFYCFFFFVEDYPRRYVRAAEGVVFFLSVVFALKLNLIRIPLFISSRATSVTILTTVVVIYAALIDLGPRFHYVTNLFLTRNYPTFESTLEQLSQPENLITQIEVREIICKKLDGGGVLVSLPQWHPFCGLDVGSIYNSGFLKYPDWRRFQTALEHKGRIFTSSDLAVRLSALGLSCERQSNKYSICARPDI